MKRAALYVRVSTEEQRKHGISVDNQIDALREYCKANGYAESGLYNDAGISARKSYRKRPALLRMIDDCRQGKADIILFTKLDRWFRSVPDYYAVMEQLKVPWKAIWEDYETETSSGVFKVNIMLSVAQAEADRTSERIRSTMAYKRQKGELLGRVPLGYVRDGKGLKMDSDASEGISAFLRSYIDYKPITECVKKANALGLPVGRSGAYYVLKNPIYIGDFITESEYNAIQRRLKGRTKKASRGLVYIFQGLCFCAECGRKMRSKSSIYDTRKGKRINKYYLCSSSEVDQQERNCPGVLINERELEQTLLDRLEPFLTAYNAHIRLRNLSADKQHYHQKKTALKGKLARVAELYEDGLIEQDEYKQKSSKLRQELSDLAEPEEQQPITLPDKWRDVYAQLNEENKRLFWRRTIREIRIDKEKNIDIIF